MSALHDIVKKVASMWSLLVGLKITTRNFFQHKVTLHYPRQWVDDLGTFRGHIELVGQPKDPAKPRCITCMLCVAVCPSQCIAITKAKTPPAEPKAAAKKLPAHEGGPLVPPEKAPPPKAKPIKTPAAFKLNYNTCSLCGLCVQNCPVSSLRFSTNAYAAGFSREEFEFDLMERLRQQAAVLGDKAAQVNSPAGEDTLERMGQAAGNVPEGPAMQAESALGDKREQA